MALSLSARFVGDVYVLRCAGRIVMGEAEVTALDQALEVGAREFTRIVLELSEVERIDSIGLGLLVRYQQRLAKRGGGVRLAAARPFVVKLLELTRLSSLLENHATEEGAILSFSGQRGRGEAVERRGPRVLVFDQSADLCVFAKTVLTRHGFDVRTTCSFADARILLRVEGVEHILVGAGTPLLPAKTVLDALHGLVPGATARSLDAEFKGRDAEEATEILLGMFGVSAEASGRMTHREDV